MRWTLQWFTSQWSSSRKGLKMLPMTCRVTPSFSHTKENIDWVHMLVLTNWRIMTGQLVEEVHLSKGTIHMILHNDLQLTKRGVQNSSHAFLFVSLCHIYHHSAWHPPLSHPPNLVPSDFFITQHKKIHAWDLVMGSIDIISIDKYWYCKANYR